MISAHARVTLPRVNQLWPQSVSATQPPEMMASNNSATPMADTSDTRPGRRYLRYTPMNRAIGMVINSEKTAQGLSARAFTTTSASTAMMMIMMTNTPMSAATPPTLPSSSLAI